VAKLPVQAFAHQVTSVAAEWETTDLKDKRWHSELKALCYSRPGVTSAALNLTPVASGTGKFNKLGMPN